jgi:hypothetical protein
MLLPCGVRFGAADGQVHSSRRTAGGEGLHVLTFYSNVLHLDTQPFGCVVVV